jgi:hypothetical protein
VIVGFHTKRRGASTTTLRGKKWFRNVIANPRANASAITEAMNAVYL